MGLMAYIKWFILAFGFACAVWVINLYVFPGSSQQIDAAADEFMKGNYADASKTLDKIKGKISPAAYHLYRAYIARETSTLQSSSEELKLAEQAADSRYLTEIYLNQALNGFLTRKPEEMTIPLTNADKVAKDKQWVVFLKTVQDYLNQNYQPALKLWKQPLTSGYLSPWMKSTFNDTFDSFWFTTRLAYANIALGDYVGARQELEKESKHVKEGRLDEINLMIGLSYVKEAQDKPPLASTPYYKLAASYLNRVPMMSGKFTSQRTQLQTIMLNQARTLLMLGSWKDVPFYFGILESWQDKQGLKQLQTQLMELLGELSQKKDWEGIGSIAKILNRQLSPEQHAKVEKQLNELLISLLESGDLHSGNELWEVVRSFAEKPKEISRNVSNSTAEQIFDLLPIDDGSLSLTEPYLAFWQSLVKDPYERLGLAALLLNAGESLWLIHAAPFEKFLAAAKASMQLPLFNDQDLFKLDVSSKLALLISQSQRENNPALLRAALRAVEALNIPISFPKKDADIRSELKEAEVNLKNKRYKDSLNSSQWILTLEPDNAAALRIAGLAAYAQANYTQAKEYLENIKNPDPEIREALEIITFITGAQDLPIAIKTRQKGSDSAKRLAFGLLLNEKAKDALEWLSQIQPATPEVIAGKSYAYMQLKDWNHVIEEYNKLPKDFKEHPSIKRMAVEAMANLGQIDEAEALLLQPAFKNIPQLEFLNSDFFEDHNPNYDLGLFYKNWKRDPEKALKHLRDIKDPSPIVLAGIGDTLLMQNKCVEARKIFQEALNQDALEYPELVKKALPPLGIANQKLGYWIESAKNFSEYFEAFPRNTSYREAFARTAMSLKRYDVAYDQLTKILKEASSDVKVSWIETLLHLAKFSEAITYAMEALADDYPMPLSAQLKIAELMCIPAEGQLIQIIINRVPDIASLSLEDSIALIRLRMALGNFDIALRLVKDLKPQLEKNYDGLVLLAEFYSKAVSVDDAIELAKGATKISSCNPKAFELLGALSPDPNLVKQKLDQDPNNPSLLMEYARQLILKSIKEGKSVKDNYDLNRAKLILKDLAVMYPSFPIIHFLLGKALFYQEAMDKCKAALDTALKFDPSYSEAYLYLGKIAMKNNQEGQAIEEIAKALFFAPNNSDLWVELAAAYAANHNAIDAAQALKRAIKFKPLNISAYLELGKIELYAENPEEAKISFESALKLEPENLETLKLLLITLHHPLLKPDDELDKERRSIYETLHKLDPGLAEDTLKNLIN